MARTRNFKELVQAQVRADKKFAEALLREGVDAMLSGDVDTGKTILRDYIKATVGFEKLGAATGSPPQSLIRMFGPRGNPQAKKLFRSEHRQDDPARLHQGNRRVREAWRGDRLPAEKPDPHVWPARQSTGEEPVQRDRIFAEARRATAACGGVG